MTPQNHSDQSAPLSQNASHPSGKSQATVAMGFVNGMLAGLRKQGIDPAPLLAATEIDIADTASRIPIDNYAALYNRINHHLDDESFGLLSRAMPCGSFEFLCRSTISAATLSEALQRASRFLRIVLPDLAVDIARHKNTAHLVIRETRPLAGDLDDAGRVFAFEWLLRLLHGLACWLAGRGLALDCVSFPYSQPAHAADYALIFTAHSVFLGAANEPTMPSAAGLSAEADVDATPEAASPLEVAATQKSAPAPKPAPEATQNSAQNFASDLGLGSNASAPHPHSGAFGVSPSAAPAPQPVLTASFNANLLDLPIRRDEAALATFLDGAPGKITTLYRRDREMVIRVRDLLRAALPQPRSLAQIADQLHLSARTVHRRLEEEGSSFRAIKDALRRDMALARLSKTREPIAQVAADLGYADSSAFYRAFIAWTGVSPLHYRRYRLPED